MIGFNKFAQSADEKFLEHKMRLFRNGWLKLRGDVNLRTALHEAVHMLAYRDLVGVEPEVFGPYQFEDFLGVQRWVNGGVSALPEEIELGADVVLIGKYFLGPRFFMLELRGEAERQQIIFEECHSDLVLYNNWWAKRYWLHRELPHHIDPLPSDLAKQIQASVHEDYCQPEFHERVWSAALEYACRIDEQTKAKQAEEAKAKQLDDVEKHGLGPAWVQFHERNSALNQK